MFQDNLKAIRQQLGFSQKEMAEKINIQQAQYSRYEIGTSPSTEILERLIKQLNININYLITGEGAMFITPELNKNLLKYKISKNTNVLIEIED